MSSSFYFDDIAQWLMCTLVTLCGNTFSIIILHQVLKPTNVYLWSRGCLVCAPLWGYRLCLFSDFLPCFVAPAWMHILFFTIILVGRSSTVFIVDILTNMHKHVLQWRKWSLYLCGIITVCRRESETTLVSIQTKQNSRCSCTRSASLEGPVELHCTQPRCALGDHHVCTKSRPLVRHHWWCFPSALPERDGNEPHWMSEGPRWFYSVGKDEK